MKKILSVFFCMFLVAQPSFSQKSRTTGPFITLTDAATITWDVKSSLYANSKVVFTAHGGSRTLNVSNLVNGGQYVILLQQDATGGENLTGGTGCTWKQRGGGGSTFTLSSTASAVDIITFTYDGTNCYASIGPNYS